MNNNFSDEGSQRLELKNLQKWEKLGYGMFIHFGMSTFVGKELPSGDDPLELYMPSEINVEQWIKTASEAGMKYAVLTAKHVAGHCLWPSKYTDYTVENSPVKNDVVGEFVTACGKYNIMPGLYYCSWDNHHKFGSFTPTDVANCPSALVIEKEFPHRQLSFTTREYQEFQINQITELVTEYGEIGEVWIDIPSVLPRCYRQELYDHIVSLQPQTVVMMNSGMSDGSAYKHEKTWPSDLIAIERFLPNSHVGHGM